MVIHESFIRRAHHFQSVVMYEQLKPQIRWEPRAHCCLVVLSRHEYSDTFYSEERCFVADYTSPDHCTNTPASSCTDDVLNFGYRVRRGLDLNVLFDGWFDSEPDSLVAGPSGNV